MVSRCTHSGDQEFGTPWATYQQASPPPDKSHSAFQTAPVPMDTVSFTVHCQPPQELCLHCVLPLLVSDSTTSTDTMSSHPQMDLVKAQNGASMPKWLQELWSRPQAEVGYVSVILGYVTRMQKLAVFLLHSVMCKPTPGPTCPKVLERFH